MDSRVGGGLESAGVPRSPLHVVFVDFERGVAPSFMESIEPIEAAGIIPHVKVMAEITLQTAEDAKKFGELRDDPLSVDFVAVLMKYSEEDTKPALYADMNARCRGSTPCPLRSASSPRSPRSATRSIFSGT